MKIKIFLSSSILAVCFVFAGSMSVRASDIPEKLIPMGIAAGINLETEGVMIVGFSDDSPAKKSGLTEGDCIVSVNGSPVSNVSELSEALSGCGTEAKIGIKRNGNELTLSVTPDMSTQTPKLGVFVRDAMAGIGTITYFDPETKLYGALGHGISEIKTGALLPSSGGKLLDCTPGQVIPGERGVPGELSGKIDSDNVLGSIEHNTVFGIFGHLDKDYSGKAMEVAALGDIRPGPAEILSGVDGTVQPYTAKIIAVYHGGDAGREMLIEITDRSLIAITGGIVRGMSGSPIIQNGKLVGAVTHVLVSDPSKGYGVSIETMLSACHSEAKTDETAA